MRERPYTLLSCCVSIDGYIGNAASRLLLSNDADLTPLHQAHPEASEPFSGHHSDIFHDEIYQLIAAFLFPLLVLVSFLLATTLTFSLAPVYIGALALTALAVWQVTGDGEAMAFEGWALVALYVIVATLTLYE